MREINKLTCLDVCAERIEDFLDHFRLLLLCGEHQTSRGRIHGTEPNERIIYKPQDNRDQCKEKGIIEIDVYQQLRCEARVEYMDHDCDSPCLKRHHTT